MVLVAVIVRLVIGDIVAAVHKAGVLPLTARGAVLAPLAPDDFQIHRPPIVKMEGGADAAISNGGLADVGATPTGTLEVQNLHFAASSLSTSRRAASLRMLTPSELLAALIPC